MFSHITRGNRRVKKNKSSATQADSLQDQNLHNLLYQEGPAQDKDSSQTELDQILAMLNDHPTKWEKERDALESFEK